MSQQQNTLQRLRVHLKGWLLMGLTGLAVSASIVHADSFVYIGADPSGAEGDFMSTATATINGKPFWQVMEPYIGQHGECQNPSINDGAKSDIDTTPGPVISQSQLNFILKGFEQSKTWLTDKSLWPLKAHQVASIDPRAPKAIPIFCSLNPAPVTNRILETINTDGDSGSASYFILKGQIPESAFHVDRDLSTAASRVLISTLFHDLVLAVGSTGGGRFFDSDTPVQEQTQNLDRFKKLVNSLFNAMTYTVVESQYGYGPSVTNNLLNLDSQRLEVDFYHLAGEYDEPFYLSPKTKLSNSTSAAFWHFLFDGYLTVGFEAVPDFLMLMATTDNPLQTLDGYINTHDGDFHEGLMHAIPNFASTITLWSYYRNYRIGGNWLVNTFGGCHRVNLSEQNTVQELDFELQPYSSTCIEIGFEPSGSHTLFDAHIKVSTGDNKVNGIEIGSAEYRKSELTRRVDAPTCYKHLGFQTNAEGAPKIERNGFAARNTCLLAFSQGQNPDNQELNRFFYLDGEEAGSTTDLAARQMILVVSYVPDEHQPYTASGSEPANTTMTFSVDVAQLQSVLFDEPTVTSVFGSKVGRAPVTPMAIEQTDKFDDAVIEGKATAVDPAVLRAVGAFSDGLIGVQDENNTSLHFQLEDPSVIDTKSVGEFKVLPVFQKDGFISIANTKKQSKINIIRHDKDTLYFEADAYICMMQPEEVMASLEQRYLDICTEGERHQVTAKVHIPFPDQFRSKTRIVWQETDNYQASRAIRLHQIKQKFSANGFPTGGPSNQTQNAGSAQRAQTSSHTPGDKVCALKQASGSCNCSCAVSRCLTLQPDLANSPEGLACRLSCGKRWRACGQ